MPYFYYLINTGTARVHFVEIARRRLPPQGDSLA
jgi:hypothetical protein